MKPEDILSHPARILTQAQRESYFEKGFVSAGSPISGDWLDRLQAASEERIEASRAITESNNEFDLAPEHSAEHPHVRRIKSPVDHHATFREFALNSPYGDIAADLVGPDVKFHSCKINYKHPGAGEIVKWHQDICFWPHTNYSPVTIGIYLDDVVDTQGPLACLPGSHEDDLIPHYDEADNWTGTISPEEMEKAGVETAEAPTGPAGSVLALNCRTIHGSKANHTDRVRPMLLYVYTSADAFNLTVHPTGNKLSGEIVRGEAVRYPHLDPRPCPMPPDWSKTGYGSIFTSQEPGSAEGMM